MSQEFNEQLSAFMDGELGRDQARFLLKRAEGDAAMVGRWTRYHVMRQTLRRQDIVALRADFAGSIMARLDGEAAVAAPRGQVWLRWGTGGAIAAAVAVAALMVTKPANEPTQVAGANPSTTRVAPTSALPAQVASTNPTQLVPNSPIATAAASFGGDVVQPASYDPRLQSYVIRHYQATGASTSQPDFVPYILLVPPADTLEARQVENR